MNVRKLTTMAMMAGLSVVLVAFIHLPIIPAAPFLEYDPADIPILITTFAFGPVAGLCVTVIASLIQGFTVSAASGIYGVIMHIVATGTYVIVAGNIYKRGKTRKMAAVALLIGAVSMAVVMVGANLVITPIFMGSSVQDVIGMLLPAILPFNLLKAGLNGLVTFFIYKRVASLMKGERVKKAPSSSQS